MQNGIFCLLAPLKEKPNTKTEETVKKGSLEYRSHNFIYILNISQFKSYKYILSMQGGYVN